MIWHLHQKSKKKTKSCEIEVTNSPENVPAAIETFDRSGESILGEEATVHRSSRRPSFARLLRFLDLDDIALLSHLCGNSSFWESRWIRNWSVWNWNGKRKTRKKYGKIMCGKVGWSLFDLGDEKTSSVAEKVDSSVFWRYSACYFIELGLRWSTIS